MFDGMEFRLNGVIHFSREAEEAREDIEKLILEANTKLLLVGAPPGKGAKIINWKLKRDRLFLTIVSGRSVRSHSAILRLKKPLATILGKHKIGLRKISAKKYEIEVPLKERVRELKLPFVEKVEIKEKRAFVTFKNLDEGFLESGAIDRIVSLIDKKLLAAYGKKERWKIVETSEKKEIHYNKDPTEEAIKRGWVKHYGTGQWIYLPPYMALKDVVVSLVMDKIIKPLNFVPVGLPKLTTLENQRLKGQLFGNTEELFYVCPPVSRDPADFERYQDMGVVTNQENPEMLQRLLKPPRFALSYAQCEPFYYYFKGQKIDVEKLKIFRAYDLTGFTYRYEAGGKRGLERMNEFTRIELAYVGKPKLVIESRDSVLDGYKKVADALGLEWRVAEAIPVYLEHAEEKSEERKDIVATYDFEVYLPFRGPRDKVEWLEVANASVTFDFYCRRFNIKEVKGRDLWFGCCGFGVERWVVSFLAQHGFDFEKWPSMVRKKIGALPKPPEIVTQPSK